MGVRINEQAGYWSLLALEGLGLVKREKGEKV